MRRFSLGAHAPHLSPADVDHIHRLWVTAVEEIGPTVHHRDIVAAALVGFEDELRGPKRGDVLERLKRQSAAFSTEARET